MVTPGRYEHPVIPTNADRCRALSFHVFGAAVLLLSEWSTFPVDTYEARREELRMALHVLDGVGTRNIIASRAASIVRTRLERRRDL